LKENIQSVIQRDGSRCKTLKKNRHLLSGFLLHFAQPIIFHESLSLSTEANFSGVLEDNVIKGWT
jgi:hypothetical protein